jgi:siroheme synthase
LSSGASSIPEFLMLSRTFCSHDAISGSSGNGVANDATRATETVITATLATLPNRLEQADTNAPCVVLIGEGVAKPAYLDAASRQKRKEKCRA